MSTIKKCFPSRWGTEGSIVETDFSSIEVVVAAVISGDPNMKQDILDGIDPHAQSASWIHTQYTYEQILAGHKAGDKKFSGLRKAAKEPRFQLQYGSGAAGISRSCGIPLEKAKGFIENYYNRYRVLKQWQEENQRTVEASREPTDKRSPGGYPLGRGYLHGPTGRAWAFTEDESLPFLKDRGIYTSFTPTTIKNYPVQGTTWDVVSLGLGELVYTLRGDEQLKDKALLVNTVHDSIVADVHNSVLEQYVDTCEKVLTSAPSHLKMYFNMEFDLPIKVETSIGPTWGETE
jgi:DNA polymerase I-like protein with 3'-5' exonuclease and polymerase domains